MPDGEIDGALHGEKHESDRGIYTITMQKSGNKNTAPIKLKRPIPTTTTVSENEFVYLFLIKAY